MKKAFMSSSLFATALLFGACSSDSTSTPTPSTTATPVATVAPTNTPLAIIRSVTDTKTIENKDGSTTVVTMYSDGSKSEVRTFKSGRLAKVTRDTPSAGVRTARVTYRDDSTDVDVTDDSWVEKSMNATGDALATAARKTKAGAIEAADKAEDVGDAVKKGTKKAASATADKAEDVGSAIKKGVKKGAIETADKAEDVGDAVKKGAKKAGSKIKDAVTPDKKDKKPNN
ncbi:MAG: hypothetical protein M3X11_25045 [Acidobacteriota bacterium]|nr:hypothetical protein [Acidobacteriota bacterium]